MSCDPSPLEKILERTFARVIELEKQLTHKTAELKDTRTTLEAVHAVLGRALRSSRNDSEDNERTNSEDRDLMSDTSDNANDARTPSPPVHLTPPSSPVLALEIGLVTQTVIRRWSLGIDVEDEIIDCLRCEHPTDWYWRFVDSCSLVHDIACELTVAMHLDADIQFDYELSIVTPYHPWNIH